MCFLQMIYKITYLFCIWNYPTFSFSTWKPEIKSESMVYLIPYTCNYYGLSRYYVCNHFLCCVYPRKRKGRRILWLADIFKFCFKRLLVLTKQALPSSTWGAPTAQNWLEYLNSLWPRCTHWCPVRGIASTILQPLAVLGCSASRWPPEITPSSSNATNIISNVDCHCCLTIQPCITSRLGCSSALIISSNIVLTCLIRK